MSVTFLRCRAAIPFQEFRDVVMPRWVDIANTDLNHQPPIVLKEIRDEGDWFYVELEGGELDVAMFVNTTLPHYGFYLKEMGPK